MFDALQHVVKRSSRGLAAPQAWSNVSAWETGWVLIEPTIESLTLRGVFDKVSTDERNEVVRRAQELFA